jgi:septum formation protein
VHTGVTLIKKKSSVTAEWDHVSFHETSHVVFAQLDDAVVKAYVETGEPLDKAGGYGIQALGSTLVSSIRGDFYNVEGFPAHRFAVELRKFLNM